jgi:hypothetical protein
MSSISLSKLANTLVYHVFSNCIMSFLPILAHRNHRLFQPIPPASLHPSQNLLCPLRWRTHPVISQPCHILRKGLARIVLPEDCEQLIIIPAPGKSKKTLSTNVLVDESRDVQQCAIEDRYEPLRSNAIGVRCKVFACPSFARPVNG